MNPAALRLDPRFPMVWRDPDTLQIGVDPAVIVLAGVDDRFLPLLHELSVGTSPGGVAVCAQAASLKTEEVDAFFERLEPVLRHAPPRPQPRVILDAPRFDPARARGMFESVGYSVVDVEAEPRGAEAVILADYVLEPDTGHSWLRRDVAHTPIVFTDQSVRVGPRVTPGVSPCLHCLFLHRVERDPSTVAIDSQLWGTRAWAHTPPLEARAAWLALQMIESDTTATVSRIDAENQQVTSEVIPFHPECGCRGLAASPDLAGNG